MATEEGLGHWVGDAADWVQNREDTAFVTSDAVPVYAKGRVEQVPLDAQGATRKDKNRLTWIGRNVILDLFKLRPGDLPRGRMLRSGIVVQCLQPCRLSDMSRTEPALWTGDHSVIIGGVLVEREKGE